MSQAETLPQPPKKLTRERFSTIATLALPIMGGMVSQNILNLVDTAMVGRVGATALAAVGLASFVNFVCISVITGLSAGVQAMASRRKGEGKTDQMAVPLNGGLLLSVLIGIPASVALFLAAPAFMPLLVDDPEVAHTSALYLEARLAAMVFIGMNFAFRGYWNAIGMSMIYMQTLVVMHVCNVFFNWVLIFGNLGFPEMGALGAGIGTSLSVFIGTVLYVVQGYRLARPNGFMDRIPRLDTLKTMMRVSLPASIQQVFFSAGFTVLFVIIGSIGTHELAAANVLVNVSQTAFLPGLGLGLAAASLVGQALGRGDAADAKMWGWHVAQVGILVMGAIGLPMVLFPELILSVFLMEQAVIDLAKLPLQISGATILVEAIAMVLLNSLQGAGATRQVMAVSIIVQWVIFLPVAYLVGPVLGLGLLGVWTIFVIYRLITAAIFATLWQRGRWASIKL